MQTYYHLANVKQKVIGKWIYPILLLVEVAKKGKKERKKRKKSHDTCQG